MGDFFRCVLLFLCLHRILCAQAQAQTVTVEGTVTAATTAVQYASVAFEDRRSPPTTFAAVTDSTGRYRLDVILAAGEPGIGLPTKFKLEQNYPNPFSSTTAIPYELKTESDGIRVTIYDILGRVVQRIAAGAQPAGSHSIVWDGSNATGQKVARGVYFYSLQAGGESQTRKMVLNAGGAGYVLQLKEHSSPAPMTGQEMDQHMPSGIFTIRIENTVNTFPPIVSRRIDDVVIEGDTTLDLPVAPLPMATVHLDSVQQYIRGFGGANILPWRPDMTVEQVQTAFGAGPGQLGLTILRLRIPYTENVSELSAQLPTATMAQSLGAIVFASPWTPPPAMKSNNNIVGGILNESSYAAYAAHLSAFTGFMASHGVPLYAVSIQNEPDAIVTYESCSWNANQFLNFTRNNAASVGTRIMMPESQNFMHELSDPTLNDSSAAANVAIIGGHVYGGGLAPYPLAASKGKEVWMTEHLDLDTSWTAVLGTGKEIHDCMNAGMNAYVWWYIVRFYGPIAEDGRVSKRGYVMSQYARFVRPGFHRVKCMPAPQRNVFLSAYCDSSSSRVVLVALNLATSAVQQAVTLTRGNPTSFVPHTTSQTLECVQGADIAVTNRSFMATLQPSSITTFVSR